MVQQALESKYTNAARNCITEQLHTDIRLLKIYLFDTYGKMNENELQEKYDETTKLTYDVSDPIDDIFNSVKDLCKVAEFENCLYSARQQVNIGYLILSKQPFFRIDVRKWMRKFSVDKTWTNFMTHFRQAHHELQ